MLTPVPGLSPDRESLISISRTGLVHWLSNSKKVIEIQDNSLIMAAKHRRVLLGAVGATLPLVYSIREISGGDWLASSVQKERSDCLKIINVLLVSCNLQTGATLNRPLP